MWRMRVHGAVLLPSDGFSCASISRDYPQATGRGPSAASPRICSGAMYDTFDRSPGSPTLIPRFANPKSRIFTVPAGGA